MLSDDFLFVQRSTEKTGNKLKALMKIGLICMQILLVVHFFDIFTRDQRLLLVGVLTGGWMWRVNMNDVDFSSIKCVMFSKNKSVKWFCIQTKSDSNTEILKNGMPNASRSKNFPQKLINIPQKTATKSIKRKTTWTIKKSKIPITPEKGI